jgi:tartrate-resistant acid phosphatase type 5
MIDTVILCGNSDHDLLKLQPHGPSNMAAAEKQWAWIEKTISESKLADYCGSLQSV